MTADAYDATLMLLGARAPGATICPSEVARMPAVHTAIENSPYTNGPML